MTEPEMILGAALLFMVGFTLGWAMRAWPSKKSR